MRRSLAQLVRVSLKGSSTTRYFSSTGKKLMNDRRVMSIVTFGATCVSLGSLTAYAILESESASESPSGSNKVSLPTYTRSEISKHKTPESRIWVTYKDGVYDVTDFIADHPGGDKILLAAGGAVDPFWTMYQQHLESNVQDLLEEMRIGYLDVNDVVTVKDPTDLFKDEPTERHPALLVKSSKPFNAEPPLSLLAESFLTPVDLFYIRNHLPVPLLEDIGAFKFTVENENGETMVDGDKTKYSTNVIAALSMEELRKYPEVDIISTIQCAGNRRSEMAKEKPVQGLQWGQAAIGNSKWTGVRLRDVLKGVGATKLQGVKHVHFEGLDRDAFGEPYGASIPIETALSKESDVILAYKMNDVELPRDHGYPVRVIVPGHVGARNVKWVNRIVLSKEESRSHWQRNDYKLVTPNNTEDHTKIPAIQQLPVQSVICIPENGSKISRAKDDEIKIAGYAVSGGGRDIIRVDISLDGGQNWTRANMMKSLDGSTPPVNRAWGWTIWSLKAKIPEGFTGPIEIICKAVDTACNQQPEDIKPVWNVRGLVCTTWHHSFVEITE